MWRAALLTCLVACTDEGSTRPVARMTFDQSVLPILEQKCSSNTGGCHGEVSGTALSIGDADRTYVDITTVWAGNFNDHVPLIEHHTSWQLLDAEALAVIDGWLAEERRERGLGL